MNHYDEALLAEAIAKEAGSSDIRITKCEIAGYCGACAWELQQGAERYLYVAELEILSDGKYDIYHIGGGNATAGDDYLKIMGIYDQYALHAYRENAGIK